MSSDDIANYFIDEKSFSVTSIESGKVIAPVQARFSSATLDKGFKAILKSNKGQSSVSSKESNTILSLYAFF